MKSEKRNTGWRKGERVYVTDDDSCSRSAVFVSESRLTGNIRVRFDDGSIASWPREYVAAQGPGGATE